MARRRFSRNAGNAIRALVALIAIGGCLAAVAYAATRPGLDPTTRPQKKPAKPKSPGVRPPRPVIIKHPEKASSSSSASFSFKVAQASPRFQCQFDRSRWTSCKTPLTLHGLAVGNHAFAVRALGRSGRRGPAARFAWGVFESKSFTIEPQLQGLPALYPGAAPVPLPLRLHNPNPVPISVTALRVGVSADALGCDRSNLELIPSSASATAPLKLPAGSSLDLPAPGATPPALALRELEVNQDACQGASFPLTFSGEAHG